MVKMTREKMTVTIEGEECFESKVSMAEDEGWRKCSHIRCIPNKAPILFKGTWRNNPTAFIFSQDFVRFDDEDLKYLNERELTEFSSLLGSQEKREYLDNHNRTSSHGKCAIQIHEKFNNYVAKDIIKFFR